VVWEKERVPENSNTYVHFTRPLGHRQRVREIEGACGSERDIYRQRETVTGSVNTYVCFLRFQGHIERERGSEGETERARNRE